MCGLALIGLGLYGALGLPYKGIKIAEKSARLYVETYTSPLAVEQIDQLKKMMGREVTVVSREFMEDGRNLLQEAEVSDVAVFVPGDPLVATTHIDLLIRAHSRGIATQVIHNSSIVSAIPGETGLHVYKFGPYVTVTREPGARLATVYHTAHRNLVRGLHTAILLEPVSEGVSGMQPREALERFSEAEKDYNLGVFGEDTFMVVASRLGQETQRLVGGRLGGLIESDYGPPPHTIILPGSLHFSEVEALEALTDELLGTVAENSSKIRRLSDSMVKRYVAKTRVALEKTRKNLASRVKFNSLLENIECYVSDSERFLNEGKDELAILSIGYAEGLLDSLRLTGEFEVEW